MRITLVVIFLVSVCAIPTLAADCGDTVAWIDAVPVQHNGDSIGTGSSCAGRGTYGWQYQCVELVNRFYNQSGWTGHAGSYYDNGPTWGLTQFANSTTTELPFHGDILCWDFSAQLEYGHVALVSYVQYNFDDTWTVGVVEQNWSETGQRAFTITDNGDGTLSLDETGVDGWLRDPGYQPYQCAYIDQSHSTMMVRPGRTYTVAIRYKNTGTDTWHNDHENFPHKYIELKSCNEVGVVESSFFNYPYDPDLNWINEVSPCTMLEDSVRPGDTATFQFNAHIQDDAANGEVPVYFRLNHSQGGLINEWSGVHFLVTVWDGWLTTQPLSNCNGPTDDLGRRWYQPEFDETQWVMVGIPDLDWWGVNRFLRYEIDWEGPESSEGYSIYFASDDGIKIFINGIVLAGGQHDGYFGAGCNEFGCVNLSGCNPWTSVPPINITSYLKPGRNTIATTVSDGGGGRGLHQFDFIVNDLVVSEEAVCCLPDGCVPLTSEYTSANCVVDGGEWFQGLQYDCTTFSPCVEEGSDGDPVVHFNTTLPVADPPTEIQFEQDPNIPAAAWYALPPHMGGDTLWLSDFYGQFSVAVTPTPNPDSMALTVTDYSFSAASLLVEGVPTGENHVRLDTAEARTNAGYYLAESGIVEAVVPSILYNNIFPQEDPIHSRSHIRGHFDSVTGILVVGSNSYNVFPDCCRGTRGNVDDDPQDLINVADLTFLVAYIFNNGVEPTCRAEANVDGDSSESINITDLTHLVAYLFTSGDLPAECP